MAVRRCALSQYRLVAKRFMLPSDGGCQEGQATRPQGLVAKFRWDVLSRHSILPDGCVTASSFARPRSGFLFCGSWMTRQLCLLSCCQVSPFFTAMVRGRSGLAAVARILLSNDGIPIERTLTRHGVHVAAHRPNMTFAQTFGGSIPNRAQPASTSAVVSSRRTVHLLVACQTVRRRTQARADPRRSPSRFRQLLLDWYLGESSVWPMPTSCPSIARRSVLRIR